VLKRTQTCGALRSVTSVEERLVGQSVSDPGQAAWDDGSIVAGAIVEEATSNAPDPDAGKPPAVALGRLRGPWPQVSPSRLEDRGDRHAARRLHRHQRVLQFGDLSLDAGVFCGGSATIRALGGVPGRAVGRTANRTRRSSLLSTLITVS
jgi:hypothetical protein